MEKNSARDDARHVNNNGLLRSGTTRRAVTFAMVSAASGAALVCAAFAWALWLCSRFLLPWLVSLVVGSAAPSPPRSTQIFSDGCRVLHASPDATTSFATPSFSPP